MELTSLCASAAVTCHSLDEWLVLHQTAASESCKMSISILFYPSPGDKLHKMILQSHSFSSTASRHDEMRNVFMTCLYFYILSILYRFMFIKCVSRTQLDDDWNVLLCSPFLWECEKWENVWRDEMNAVAVWDVVKQVVFVTRSSVEKVVQNLHESLPSKVQCYQIDNLN